MVVSRNLVINIKDYGEMFKALGQVMYVTPDNTVSCGHFIYKLYMPLLIYTIYIDFYC